MGADVEVRFRSAPAVALVVADQVVTHGLVGGDLVARIQSGVDAEAVGQRVIAEAIQRIEANLLGNVGRVDFDRWLMRERLVWLGAGLLELRGRDEAVVEHALQRVVAPFGGARAIAQRVAARREFRQRGEHCAFGQAQLVERLAVVELGGGSDAVGTVAEKDLVEVKLEDFVLGQFVLDAEREEYLGRLARQADFGTQEKSARDLLRDRAAARHMQAALDDHVAERAQDAGEVDARVAVEVRVFRREKGVLQLLGDVLDLDRDAARLADRGDQLRIAGVDTQRNLQAYILEHVDGRQARLDQPVGDSNPDGADHDAQHAQNQEPTEQTSKYSHA